MNKYYRPSPVVQKFREHFPMLSTARILLVGKDLRREEGGRE